MSICRTTPQLSCNPVSSVKETLSSTAPESLTFDFCALDSTFRSAIVHAAQNQYLASDADVT